MPWMSVTKDGMLETMIKYSFHCMVHSKIEKKKKRNHYHHHYYKIASKKL